MNMKHFALYVVCVLNINFAHIIYSSDSVIDVLQQDTIEVQETLTEELEQEKVDTGAGQEVVQNSVVNVVLEIDDADVDMAPEYTQLCDNDPDHTTSNFVCNEYVADFGVRVLLTALEARDCVQRHYEIIKESIVLWWSKKL